MILMPQQRKTMQDNANAAEDKKPAIIHYIFVPR
jgi:hypothetical protein